MNRYVKTLQSIHTILQNLVDFNRYTDIFTPNEIWYLKEAIENIEIVVKKNVIKKHIGGLK